jgi:DNA-binding IclR family transcriptional regulator
MLVSRTGQSAHAMILDGTLGLVVATVESPSALRVIMRVGEHRYLHATAGGKLFLAFSDHALLDAAIQHHGLPTLTGNTIADPKKLRAELQGVQRTKLAWNNGESNTGAGAVAAPVLDDGGHIVAAITSVYPLNVVGQEQQKKVAKETLAISRKISEKFRSARPAAS